MKTPPAARGVPGLRLERVGYGHPQAVAFTAAAQRFYAERYGESDGTPLEPAMFEPPVGSFFLAYAGAVPVACGGWRRREDVEALGTRATAEVKRMYVDPRHRRAGHARGVLAHLEETMRAAGAEAAILETGTGQPEAIAFYLAAGYERIADFGFYCGAPEVRSFGRRLAG